MTPPDTSARADTDNECDDKSYQHPLTDDGRQFLRAASELEYHARVLAGAADATQLLLERIRFCSFFTLLTDEFFRVRLVGLKEKSRLGGPDGVVAAERLATVRKRFRYLAARQHDIWWNELRPALAEEGIELAGWDELDKRDRAVATDYYRERIYPLLTPLAVGPAHPFPFISDLSLSVGVRLDGSDGGPEFVRVKIPESLRRFIEVRNDADGIHLIRVEEVIGAHLSSLFPGRKVRDHHLFRVTRDADYEVDTVDVEDLLETVSMEVRDRQFGDAMRLEVAEGMPMDLVVFLAEQLELSRDEVLYSRGPLNLGEVGELYALDRPELKRPALQSVDVEALSGEDVFANMRKRDHLVQHPYESFASSTQNFIDRAADDDRVLAIKQTLYRTSGESPVVNAMIRAAQQRKQAVMLVELKARFDEEANIGWAEKLGAAGVHVVFGFVELKTHTKTAVVVREDEDGQVRSYGHIGTGNYNPSTARFYEDLALFTTDPVITNDLLRLFNMLTGHTKGLEPERLLIAPTTLRPRLVELIESQAHPGGRIVVKVNHIAHDEAVEALYAASEAGASIDLIVRTTCTARPGVKGMSKNIRVKSVVAPVLEHSRIYKFGDDPEKGGYLIGSADMMVRNLDNRVEAVVPIDQPDLRQRLDAVLDELLADEALSWTLDSKGRWHKVAGDRNAQENLAAAAKARNRATSHD